MRTKSIFHTFSSRFLILLLNFGIIVFSTNFWGAEGRGVIALLVADLAVIGFFTNIIVGSSISYFAAKLPPGEILTYAYIWAVVCGISLPLLMLFNAHSREYLPYLIILSVLIAVFTANISLFLGQQKLERYNSYSALQNILHFLMIGVMVFLFKWDSVETYFKAQVFSYLVLVLITFAIIWREIKFTRLKLSQSTVKKLFSYGGKTQLSAFLQFLNYRLSFYFLEIFRGVASVGVFSVGAAFSESVWTVSRSLALVLYSDVVNNPDHHDSVAKTKFSMKLCFLATILLLVLMLLIPTKIYMLIFGDSFHEVKNVILVLSPGILIIAVSDIVGYYFAATHQLRILNIKSAVGLVVTVFCGLYAIPKWGLIGAGIVTSLSYSVSSLLLFWKFYQNVPFKGSDLFFTQSEFQQLLNMLNQKFFKK